MIYMKRKIYQRMTGKGLENRYFIKQILHYPNGETKVLNFSLVNVNIC